MILNMLKISEHDNSSLVAISSSANDTAPWQPKPAYTHAYAHIFWYVSVYLWYVCKCTSLDTFEHKRPLMCAGGLASFTAAIAEVG